MKVSQERETRSLIRWDFRILVVPTNGQPMRTICAICAFNRRESHTTVMSGSLLREVELLKKEFSATKFAAPACSFALRHSANCSYFLLTINCWVVHRVRAISDACFLLIRNTPQRSVRKPKK